MSSLNLSANGQSISKSYQSVLNAPPPTGPPASSPTYAQWAIFYVAAPLVSAFQNDGAKESIMKVQSTGEGELIDCVEEFSDGRIQFGFIKVKDPNTTLPKCVLVGWCGEGVPERTKGYFTSHLAAVARLFQGYHVQITARSDRDLTPEGIIQKVADASGSKYSGGGSASAGVPPPPIASKPVFTPTQIRSASSSFNPLGSRAPPPSGPVDEDGWGQDAPPITRSQLEKVPSAYKPTKVNMATLSQDQGYSDNSDVTKGAYQPIGKVDIAEIRRQAKESGQLRDDRPTPIKGAYEPIGKVDIAAIRARAQPPSDVRHEENEPTVDRSATFDQSERLTSLPKPRVSGRLGSGSSFSGTRAPVPVGFTPKTNPSAAPVGMASRTFADEGGKTPAQLWAEKKRGGVISPAATGAALASGAALATGAALTSPIKSQGSGEGWKSSYTGKTWAPVQTTRTGQSAASNVSDPRSGDERTAEEPSAGNVGSIRDRFSANPAPLDLASKPNAGARAIPTPPENVRPSSPIRVAMPVSRTREDEDAPGHVPSSAVASSKPGKRALVQYDYEKAEDNEIELKEGEYVTNIEMVDEDWWMGQNSAGESGLFPANYVELADDEAQPAVAAPAPTPAAGTSKKPTATAQYDYDAAEDNELSFPDGAKITNVEFPDEDWWLGEYNGKTGLFPANYVQLDE